jgi:hypothetical protein
MALSLVDAGKTENIRRLKSFKPRRYSLILGLQIYILQTKDYVRLIKLINEVLKESPDAWT